jgi:hypothetical protein
MTAPLGPARSFATADLPDAMPPITPATHVLRARADGWGVSLGRMFGSSDGKPPESARVEPDEPQKDRADPLGSLFEVLPGGPADVRSGALISRRCTRLR